MMLFTLAMEGNKQAYCRGYVILSDQADITLRHAMMMTPGVLKQHMVVFQVARYIYSCSSILSILSTGLLPDGQPGPDRQLAAVPGEHAGAAGEVPQHVQVQDPLVTYPGLDLYYPHLPQVRPGREVHQHTQAARTGRGRANFAGGKIILFT